MKNVLVEVCGGPVSWAYNENEYVNTEALTKAIKYAEYSWWDIQVGFREVGVVPTKDEEMRIKEKLIRKKYSYMTKD